MEYIAQNNSVSPRTRCAKIGETLRVLQRH